MKLVYQSGPRHGQEQLLEPGQSLILGRDEECDLVIDDERASRRHARIRVADDGSVSVEDLNSTNGTLVNGARISGSVNLGEGDSISIGNTRIQAVGDGGRGAKTVVAGSSRRSSSGLTQMRATLGKANRTAQLAAGVAAVLLLVVIAGAVTMFLNRAPSNEEIIAKMRPSTVLVESDTQLTSGGSGTGWVLDAERGLIVTNNHVIAGGTDITISGENMTPRSANIVASAPCEDLAVLHVDDKAGMATAQLGSQSALRQGDAVLAIGYPGTASSVRNLVVTTGTVSIVNTTFAGAGEINDLPNVTLTTARINAGNSGGPLVNRSSQVVGVNSIGNIARDENWAIGIDRVKEVTATLSQGRGMGWTGMTFEILDEEQRSLALLGLGLPDEPGLLVLEVVPGTKAADAGFGSVPVLITAIDGQPMDGQLKSYCRAVGGRQPGQTARFSLAIPDENEIEGFFRQDFDLEFQ